MVIILKRNDRVTQDGSVRAGALPVHSIHGFRVSFVEMSAGARREMSAC